MVQVHAQNPITQKILHNPMWWVLYDCHTFGYKKNENTNLVGLIGYKKGHTHNVWIQGDPSWDNLVRLDKNPILVRFPVRLNENHSRIEQSLLITAIVQQHHRYSPSEVQGWRLMDENGVTYSELGLIGSKGEGDWPPSAPWSKIQE